MANGHHVRILLADAQSLFRDAIRSVLEHEADLEVVEEAGDGVEAVTKAERIHPDVALLDANLPNCDGVRATRLIRERVPDCQVVVLTDEEDQASLLKAVEAGASGYLTKGSPLTELMEATRAVARGETLIPGRMLGELLARLVQRRKEYDDALARLARLSRREREVLALLAEGGDNDSIAQALVISPQTARTHIQNVLRKLEVHSRLEAAAFVIQNGVQADLVGVERRTPPGPGLIVEVPDGRGALTAG